MNYFLRFLLVGSAACCLLSVAARADIIAEDDFSAPGSGTGWAAGDDWDGVALGGAARVTDNVVFRNLANPIDTTALDKLYLSFELSRRGGTFSGVSFFNGENEEFFLGHVFSSTFGFSVSGINDFPADVPLDEKVHLLTLEVDFGGGDGGNDLIRLFIDHLDFSNPNLTAQVGTADIPDTLTGLRIGGSDHAVVDNLCVSDSASLCSSLALGLEAYWRFDGDASDDSGKGNHGTLVEPATFTAGQLGQALDLREGPGWVDVATPVLDHAQSCSTAYWISVESFDPGDPEEPCCNAIFAEEDFPLGALHNNVVPDPPSIEWSINGGADAALPLSESAPTPWMHVAFTYDSSTGETSIYQDGQLVSRETREGSFCGSGGTSRIGAWRRDGEDHRFLNARLDDMRIYSRALSDQDVEDLAALPDIGFPAEPPIPDLDIALVGLSLSAGGPSTNAFPVGSQVFAGLTVTNTGDGFADASTLTISLNDEVLTTVNVAGLGSGETQAIADIDLGRPDPGWNSVRGTVDAGAESLEQNLVNNEDSLGFQVGGPQLLTIPQFGAVPGLTSEVVVSNRTVRPVQGSVFFFDESGLLLDSDLLVEGGTDFQLEALETTTFQIPSDRNVTGSALISSDQPVSALIRFGIEGSGIAGVGSNTFSGNVAVPVRIAGNLNTGVAVRNNSSAPQRIHATLFQEGIWMSSTVLEIPHNGRISRFISEIFPGLEGMAGAGVGSDFSGELVLTSQSCCFGAISLELEVGRAFTTLPVADLASIVASNPPDTPFLLPVPGGLRFSPDECDPATGCTIQILAETTQGVLDPETGQPLPLGDDDTERIEFPAGFPYFGQTYDHVFVNSDGNITLDRGDVSSAQRDTLRHVFGPPRISPYFRDLNPSSGGQVLADVREDRLVVTWQQVPVFGQPAENGNTFQAVLFSDGRIEFNYEQLLDDFSGLIPYTIIGIAPGFGQGGFKLVDWGTELPAQFRGQALYQQYTRIP